MGENNITDEYTLYVIRTFQNSYEKIGVGPGNWKMIRDSDLWFKYKFPDHDIVMQIVCRKQDNIAIYIIFGEGHKSATAEATEYNSFPSALKDAQIIKGRILKYLP